MKLDDLFEIKRVGNVLLDEGKVGVPEFVHDLAGSVEQLDTKVWKANSALEASAWLLEVSHYNSLVASLPEGIPDFGDQDRFTGAFRGQPARYDQFTPSMCRPGVDRALQRGAQAWFKNGLQVWSNSFFEFLTREDGTFMFGDTEAEAIAQHYGIGTNYIDWTWDPLVGFAFAADQNVGDDGAVFFAGFESAKSNVVLAPPSVIRPWKQRGFFQYQPCLDIVEDPLFVATGLDAHARTMQSGSTYYKITFPVDDETKDFAVRMRNYLYPAGDFLAALKERCVAASVAGGQLDSNSRSFSVDDYIAHYTSLGVEAPDFSEAQKIKENIGLMLEYLDSCALVYDPQNGRLGYSTSSLAGFRDSIGVDCALNNLSYSGDDVRLRYTFTGRHSSEIKAFEKQFPVIPFGEEVTNQMLTNPRDFNTVFTDGI